MSFHEKLRATREQRGYTQQQVADFMKIDKSTYCGYETGKRQPDVAKIKQLSAFLGVSGDILLETGFAEENIPPLSPDEEQLLGIYRSLNAQGKEYILQTADLASRVYVKNIDLPGVENVG